MSAPLPVQLRIHASISDIPGDAWDALLDEESIPFLEWRWLAALEESGSVSPSTGWHPRHLTLWRGSKLVAAAPAYLGAPNPALSLALLEAAERVLESDLDAIWTLRTPPTWRTNIRSKERLGMHLGNAAWGMREFEMGMIRLLVVAIAAAVLSGLVLLVAMRWP